MATTVKAMIILPTAEARDQWIADAEAAIAGRTLKPGMNAFVAPSDEIAPNSARMKFTLINDGQARTVANLIITSADSRGVLPDSFVRATREDGVVLVERYW